jgi:hypothetical protein
MNRAATISGRPGKATAVDTSTTGLIAGAESRKASAAAPGVPRSMSRLSWGAAIVGQRTGNPKALAIDGAVRAWLRYGRCATSS